MVGGMGAWVMIMRAFLALLLDSGEVADGIDRFKSALDNFHGWMNEIPNSRRRR